MIDSQWFLKGHIAFILATLGMTLREYLCICDVCIHIRHDFIHADLTMICVPTIIIVDMASGA